MQNLPQIYQKSCYGLKHIQENSIEAVVTDPPYGLGFQGHDWDKGRVPDPRIWTDCLRVMKPGAFALVFSFPRLMHRVMVDLEDAGFDLIDVLFWVYLNGMPKTRNIALEIDKLEGVESKIVGKYTYKQGYEKDKIQDKTYKVQGEKYKKEPASTLGKKFKGAGLRVKPAYEPIIMVQKPIEKGLTIAKNVQKYETGVLNLEETRIPYAKGEGKVGHNPHPEGRVSANILRTGEFADNYDKYFTIEEGEYDNFYLEAKVRQKKDSFNYHPTIKPINLMSHLVKLVSFEGQTILDPFMGSGSTALASMLNQRNFVGYEKEKEYFEIAKRRIEAQNKEDFDIES